MATYKKNGARMIKLEKNFEIKQHLKEFRKMLRVMEKVAKELYTLDVVFDTENIDAYAAHYVTRELDDIEKAMLIGRINILRNERDND